MSDIGFVTFDMFRDYAFFVQAVYLFVAFTKDLNWKFISIKRIPTMYYSFFVAYTMLIVVNVYFDSFKLWDLFPYLFTGAIISLSSNGMASINDKRKVGK